VKSWLFVVTLLVGGFVCAATPDADYATRCAATGVVLCHGLDTETELQSEEIGNAGDGTRQAFIDAINKVSGAGSLRFKLRGTRNDTNIGGYWEFDLTQNFGNSSTLYIAYDFMISPKGVDNNNNTWQSSAKLLNVHGVSSTCQRTEFTMVLSPSPTTGQLQPSSYIDCNGIDLQTDPTSGTSAFLASCGAGDCRKQQASSFTNGTNVGYNCDYQSTYQSATPGDGNGAGCLRIQPYVWYTMIEKIGLGNRGSSNTTYDAWIQPYSGGPLLQFHKVTSVPWDSTLPSDTSLRKARFETYMTEIHAAAGSGLDAYINFDELIISTQPIAGRSGLAPKAPTSVAAP
jgi:hypothetical protein